MALGKTGEGSLETRSLLNFITVAETQNIGRAAERLNITQPALTRQIQALEEEIGVALFIRSSAGVELTAAGRAMLHHARTIKAELAQAKADARDAERTERARMHLGVYGSAIFSVVPRLLAEFSKTHPDIDFRLYNTRKDQQIELLRAGEILLVIDRFLPFEDDFGYETIYRESLEIALHKDHPLVRKEVIEWDEIKDTLGVSGNYDTPLVQGLNQITGNGNHHVRHRADDMLTAISLVSAGLGVCLAPPSIRALNFPDVVFRHCQGQAKVPFDVQCMYRRNDRSALLQEFLQTVRAFRESAAA
jgi:DNA-binding transcriptional LysR family regulator